MFDRIRHNFGLKALSFAIALAAWAYLRLTPNPVIAAARFEQQISVPLATEGLPPDEVARFAERQVVVVVDVPRDGGTIKPDMVSAVLNLGQRGPGVYNLPVEVIAPKLDVKSLSPASVTLAVERIESRSLPIETHYTGFVRPGIVVSSAQTLPLDATLRAATSDLRSVAGIRVDVPLASTPTNFDAMLRPVAVDRRGVELPDIAVTPNLVRERVRFVQSGKAP